jgi:hypothetical protein
MITQISRNCLKYLFLNGAGYLTYSGQFHAGLSSSDGNFYTPSEDDVVITVTSIIKDGDGVLLSIDNKVWEWNSVNGQVRYINIYPFAEAEGLRVDLEQDMACDGKFTVNWSEIEFIRFQITDMM